MYFGSFFQPWFDDFRSVCPPRFKIYGGHLKSGTLGTRRKPDQRMFRTTGAQYTSITVSKQRNNLHLGATNKECTKQNTDVTAVRTPCHGLHVRQTTANHGHLARAGPWSAAFSISNWSMKRMECAPFSPLLSCSFGYLFNFSNIAQVMVSDKTVRCFPQFIHNLCSDSTYVE